MQFQRHISPTSLIFAGISSVIGSGWLFGPLFAAQIAGPAAIFSWLIGGILMITIAFTFSELGTAFPVAGGLIHFAELSHGPLLSFVIGWMVWLSSVAVAPVETLSLIHYTANYIPGLLKPVDNTYVLSGPGTLAAAFVMLIMVFLNYFGTKFFSRANTVITFIKLFVPITTVILLLTIAFQPSNFVSKSQGFMPYGIHGVLAALPLAGVIYSFIGSNTILQLAGETSNPQRSIPLALIGSMIFCTLLYMLLQIAFIGAIPYDAFSQGWHTLHFVGDTGPFSGIMVAIGLAWFVFFIYADAVISPFGTGFVFTASTARVTYGLSEVSFFPKFLQNLNANGIPYNGLILNYLVGLLLFLPFPAWQKLVSFIVSCFIVSYIIGPLSLDALRKSKPDVHRPFLLPYPRLIAIIAFYICNLLIFWSGWETISKMLVALAIGFIWYIIRSIKNHNKNWRIDYKRAWWLFPYFISMAIISYFGTFGGGKNIIPFGIDFLIVFVVSTIIYYCALYSIKIDD